MKETAESYLGHPVKDAVVTVPTLNWHCTDTALTLHGHCTDIVLSVTLY
jgi:hypothetical protein